MSSILCPCSYYCPQSRGATQSGPDDYLWLSTLAEFDSCQISPSAARDEQQGWAGAGVGVSQGHQGHMTWDGTGASVAGLQRTMKAASGGTELWADSFLTPTLPFLTPSTPIPWTYQGWVDEVFGYAESMIWWGKLKNEVTEAMRWCISTAQPRALWSHQMSGRQAMNGAEGLRSTFGFIDTKGKPNELAFCFSVFMEKPTSYSGLLHQVWCLPPLDAQWIILIKNKIKNKKTQTPKPGSYWSLGWSMQAPFPRKKRDTLVSFCWKFQGTSRLVSPLSHSILTFKDKNTYPCLAPVVWLWEGVSIARTFPEQGG